MSIASLVYDMETDILVAIAGRLSRGSIASADWMVNKLSELGALNKELKSIIASYRAEIVSGTGKEINLSAKDMLEKMKQASPKQYRMLITMSPGLQSTVNAWIETAKSDLNYAMATLAEKAGSQYVASIAKASLSVVSGTDTLRNAIKQSITETASQGIPAYVDKAGRNWSPEGYTAMVLRTNQRRASTAAMFAAGEMGGTDLVEISSHLASRPDHYPMQGKIYSRTGNNKDYPKLYETEGWGTPAGLFGPNCMHLAYPFWEGISEPQEKQPLTENQNDKAYELSQQQRAIEREIRDAKRKNAVYSKNPDMKDKAAQQAQRVKDKQAEMRAFIKESGRTRRNDREQVYS